MLEDQIFVKVCFIFSTNYKKNFIVNNITIRNNSSNYDFEINRFLDILYTISSFTSRIGKTAESMQCLSRGKQKKKKILLIISIHGCKSTDNAIIANFSDRHRIRLSKHFVICSESLHSFDATKANFRRI